MELRVDISPSIAEALRAHCEFKSISECEAIEQAVTSYVQQAQKGAWPDAVFDFEPMRDPVRFEALREDGSLLPPVEESARP